MDRGEVLTMSDKIVNKKEIRPGRETKFEEMWVAR